MTANRHAVVSTTHHFTTHSPVTTFLKPVLPIGSIFHTQKGTYLPEPYKENAVMQFARRFWMAAFCAIGVLVSATAAQAQATKLLPNDTELVVTINFAQVLKSDVAKANKALVELAKAKIADTLEEKGVDKWLKKADFDLFRDLTSMTLAIPNGRPPEEGFIVLTGKFDADKIEAAALEAGKDGGGLKISKIAGIKAFEISPMDEKTMYVGILNKKTMIACATKKDFEEAVARSNGTTTPKFKSDTMKELLKTVNDKQSISMVATSALLIKLSENNPNAGNPQAKGALDQLKKMEGFSAAITIQKDIDFQVGVNAKDDKTAKEFAALGNAGVTFGKAALKEKAKDNAQLMPVLEVLETIRITSEGNNLLVRGQISFETLEKLLSNLPM